MPGHLVKLAGICFLRSYLWFWTNHQILQLVLIYKITLHAKNCLTFVKPCICQMPSTCPQILHVYRELDWHQKRYIFHEQFLIANKWLTHESLHRKPNWQTVRNWLFQFNCKGSYKQFFQTVCHNHNPQFNSAQS